MKPEFDKIFELYEIVLCELENPNWNSGGRVHNWKNYVSDDIRKIWKQFSFREKRIIASYAEKLAQNEEWD